MAGRADAFPSGSLAAPRLEDPDEAERHLVLGVIAVRSRGLLRLEERLRLLKFALDAGHFLGDSLPYCFR